MKKTKNNGNFSIDVKIYDENGKQLFHFKRGRRNLYIGMKKTEEFIVEKLGVKFEPYVPLYSIPPEIQKKIDQLVEQGFGIKKK